MTKWTNEKLNELQNLRDAGMTTEQIAQHLNESHRNIRYGFERMHVLERQGRFNPTKSSPKQTPTNDQPVHRVNKDGSISSNTLITVRDGEQMTDEQLLKAHGLDPHRFVVERYTSNIWGKPSKDKTSYQTKITVKPSDFDIEQLLYEINDDVKPLPPRPSQTLKPNKKTLLIPLYDVHWGINRYTDMSFYLDQMRNELNYHYENVIVVIGGDWFHSDKVTKSVTARGTELDPVDMPTAVHEASRWFDELMDAVTKTSKHVMIVGIPGNHDKDTQYMWLWGEKQRYQNVVDAFEMTLSTTASMRVNNVGLLFAHGDLAKKRLPMIFANEHKQNWSKTVSHYIFTGHFHKELTEDDFGVVHFQVATPKPNDEYEKRNGFTMAKHKLQLFEFDDKELTAVHYLYN